MHARYALLILSALSGYIFALQSAMAETDDPVTPPVPLHEQTLALLKSSDSVVPPVLDSHPVTAMYNREAIIPPQCYTRTEGRFNPCYVCHQNEIRGHENTMNDGNLQRAYSFSDLGMTNHWRNLFEDRTSRAAAITDVEIRDWIDDDNYSDLAPRLRAAGFKGWIPDLANLSDGAAAFDEEGFAIDGSHWVAFNYKPLPSTFWPTNGSTDDVMIRLPRGFRSLPDGEYSRDIYRANLAILEANIKGLDAIDVGTIDERKMGTDLDGNGTLGMAKQIRSPKAYVGAVQDYPLLSWLYPPGTEFLHTVRYVGVSAGGTITHSRRMKEVRYMIKTTMFSKPALVEFYRREGYAKDAGYLPGYIDLGQRGLHNDMGWALQGFIEDRHGRLRANTFEETMFCMGCHTSVGTTIDKTFSFPRKVDGDRGWGYIDLHGMPDAPNIGETKGEIATYLERVGGDEFRSNKEMHARYFRADGSIDHNKVAAAGDVYTLITPSAKRALELNKAYRLIVEDQDFLYGRDATLSPPANVYKALDNKTAPTLANEHIYKWDIRLNWGASKQAQGTGEH